VKMCEDCRAECGRGTSCGRRTRCSRCGQMVCGQCYNYVHGRDSDRCRKRQSPVDMGEMVVSREDSIDSVRVVAIGEGLAVTIPVSFLSDADAVLKHCVEWDSRLEVWRTGGETGRWNAQVGDDPDSPCGAGDTPWGAIVSLARFLEAKGR
jgi:hypothetical protein